MEKETPTAMTVLLSDNIISALGFTSEENYLNVKQGISGLKQYVDRFGVLKADREANDRYINWVRSIMSERGVIEGAVEDALAKMEYEKDKIISEKDARI
ncbi:MAG: hypothetical protein LBN11_05790, partial [Tannerella sp.]|nr:hypothetical protein [Tannerella sp.]